LPFPYTAAAAVAALRGISAEFDGNQFLLVYGVFFITLVKKLTISEHIISMPWLVGVDDWLASYGTREK